MGKFFDSLTKSGLQDQDGNTAFYGSPQAALDAANASLSKAPHPTVSMVPPTQVNVTPAGALPPGTAGPTEDPDNPRPPVLTTSGDGVQVSSPTPNVGKIVKPSFNDINVDSAGNQKRLTPNSGLTKLGALFSILSGGVQGMSDAMASGAMDAHNGPDRPSAFGAGLRGAQEMPLVRAARAREVAEQNAKLEQTEAQTQNLQGETALHQAQIPYFLQRGKAYNALAQQRGNLSTQQQLDLATQDAIDAGRSPDIDPNVLQLRAALKAETEAKGKGGAGTGGASGATPHTIQTRDGVMQFNPETGRYDIKAGDLPREPRQPRAPTDTELWEQAFQRDNGRPPNAQEITDYKRNNGDRPATRGQITAADTRKNNDLNALSAAYKWDGKNFVNRKDPNDVLSEDEYYDAQQRIQDAFEQEREDLTGEPQTHVDVRTWAGHNGGTQDDQQPADNPQPKKPVAPFLKKGKNTPKKNDPLGVL